MFSTCFFLAVVRKLDLSQLCFSLNCQGCSLRLTGTRGLVGESGVERVMDAFGS